MKLRSKAAALLLLALAALLLALLSLRAGRAEPPAPPARPASAPQRHPAPVPARWPAPGALPVASPGVRRRRPQRPRPRAGRRGAARLEKLARRPGEPRSFQAVLPPELWIHLAVVACGNRLEETLVMLKSAVLFSHRKIQFHIFTEDSLKPELISSCASGLTHIQRSLSTESTPSHFLLETLRSGRNCSNPVLPRDSFFR